MITNKKYHYLNVLKYLAGLNQMTKLKLYKFIKILDL
jgi:hypothetical protein